ncbi:MAG: hypothetical protein IJR06_01245 [Paludibacteraceae bacterium]|nr:hypothetical protein [Paludibacteraceae bacterium]
MEQKFLLKEIVKHIADVEADLVRIRENLTQYIQFLESEETEENVCEDNEAGTENCESVEMKPEAEPKAESTESPVLQNGGVKAAHKVDGRLITDLRKVIGLNDRIRFQRELFGGDSELMNSTISYLNEASSYLEALEYLAENFNWDDENETVKYFKDILSRKSYS